MSLQTQSAHLPVVIIGAGPAGLMAAEVLAQAGYQVQVYEQKPSAARKFLMAGKTGLNISHNEDFAQFVQRYDHADWLQPMLAQFTAHDIQDWMRGLGVESYVGSSGRIFPLAMKAAPLLRAWLTRLKQLGVQFFYRHQWTGWSGQQLYFHSLVGQVAQAAQAVILATGGGSWARLGSDGAWQHILQASHIPMVALSPSNAGVEVAWSTFMRPLAGQPLKRVNAWVNSASAYMGEAVISGYGLEGGLIYRLNRDLRQQLAQQETAFLYFDLMPDLSKKDLIKKLQPHNRQSLATRWRKAGLDQVKMALIREYLPKEHWHNVEQVAMAIKGLRVPVRSFRPIDEAISTAGGVDLAGLDQYLMLRQKPGIFCCGEMLDWDAPTGGYLLTACLATGRQAGFGVMRWLADETMAV